MAHSLYEIKFNGLNFNYPKKIFKKFPISIFTEKIEKKKLCESNLNSNELNALIIAIEEHYYFEFVVDDIPIRGFIGQVEETNLFPHKHYIYVYTHHHFDFHINNNQVRKFI